MVRCTHDRRSTVPSLTPKEAVVRREVSPRTGYSLIAVALAVLGLVVWRATLGMSFQDDSYYAAGAVRLALGARLFVDEMFLQSLGFLAAVPFAKLWTSLFGLTGVVLALRLFYVAVAAATVAVVYRLLRPSFGAWASFAGAAAPFLAPAYTLFAVTYNTMAALGMTLACALVFAAVRDGRRGCAAAAGVAAAIASVSYPPLMIAAFVLLATLAVRGRDRRLVGAMVAGAAVVAGAFAVWLFATTSVAELEVAYRFIVGSWSNMPESVKGNRVAVDLWELATTLGRSWGLPLWAWFIPAALVGLSAGHLARHMPARARARGLALACLPVALALPVFANRAALGGGGALATLGGNYLIAFVLFVAPALYGGLRGARPVMRDLVLMALPVGSTGFLTIVLSSNASIYWASGIVGLAPLVVAVVVWWTAEITETLGVGAARGAAASLLLALLVTLFGSAFKDDPPLTLRHTIVRGAYAGVTTNSEHAEQVAEFDRLARRWIGADTAVTAVGLPGAYLVTGGVPLANNVWLNPGSFDVFTVEYLDRSGRWPDVVWVQTRMVEPPPVSAEADPLLSAVLTRYRLVERSMVTGVSVFVDNDAVQP